MMVLKWMRAASPVEIELDRARKKRKTRRQESTLMTLGCFECGWLQ